MKPRTLLGLALVMGCAADLDSEALVGTWELQEVSGETCTLLAGGELEVTPDLTGTFEWTLDCMDAGVITEISTVEDLSIERPDLEYSFNIKSPTEIFDWECVISAPEMDCTETSGAGDLRIFKFTREL